MPLDPISQIGEVIGGMNNQQQDNSQNISEDDTLGHDVIIANFNTVLTGTVVVNMNVYPTDSFIIDHPVYGDIDSAVLHIDGGYLAGSTDIELDSSNF